MTHTILLAGFAFSVAGAMSMFFSTYLSGKAEIDSLRMDMEREKMEIETEPEEERSELEQLLKKDGYDQREVEVIMERLVTDKELWLAGTAQTRASPAHRRPYHGPSR